MGGPIPELDVSDLDRSLAFYVGVIGFAVMFDRPEERFAFLTLDRTSPPISAKLLR
jgi:catechol 2,3-dioxygenase-like lactoylglutathione lyase family enzyme